MAKQDDKPRDRRDLRRQAREVADSLAIAFILAMVIRHYVLEVFKIPTKSMEPTLLGDPWSGDKILVNKFAYDFRDPRRWEIAVFKYPVDTGKNYIKRVVGLPGETIRVRYGDLYVNGAIARKPWHVQQALWRLCPGSGEASAWRPATPRDGSRWTLADGAFAADAADEPQGAELRYGEEILAYDENATRLRSRPVPHIPTADVMVEFHLIPQAAGGRVSVRLDVVPPSAYGEPMLGLLDSWDVRFPLDGPQCVPEVWRGNRLFDTGAPCQLAPGRPTLVQVANVDRSLIVRVDGREVLAKDYEPSAAAYEQGSFANQARVRLTCTQARAAFRDPAIYVDVFYTDNPSAYAVRSPYKLGPDEFFVLGDNSVNSNDSRAWKKVPRSYLVGEAFLVLWPLGRMKLVR